MKFVKKFAGIAMAIACAASTLQGLQFFTADAATISSSSEYGQLKYVKYDEGDDGVFDYIQLTGCDTAATEIEIPEEIDGLPVRVIDGAFQNCSNLTSITIPDCVTTIWEGSFIGCESLKAINVSENNSTYLSIDGVLFDPSYNNRMTLLCCPAGKSGKYDVPKSYTTEDDWTYNLTTIGGYAFYGCSKLTSSIEIPDTVTSIGSKAFYGCSSLESINIPDGVASINYGTFYGCSSLKSIEIPDSVTSIAASALQYCSSLTSVDISENVTDITSTAFSGCSSLTEINVSENNGSYCSVDGVVFDKDKTELMFFACGKSGEYIVPDGVTSIYVSAFLSSPNLTSVELPESVASIGLYAFNNCPNLTKITIYNPECAINDWMGGTIPDTAIIYGYEDSTAQTYAEEYNLKFAVIGSEYILLGDANGDGELKASDAAFIAKTLAQVGISGETISAEDYPAMDYNQDGKITALDASAIAKYLAQKAMEK